MTMPNEILAKCPRSPFGGRQHGTALIIALIMLLILTVGGVTSMRNSTLQERMAGNMRDREIAFQAAEGALREGEHYLNNFTSTPTPAADPFFYSDGNAPAWDAFDCSDPNVQTVDVDPAADSVACFIVESKFAATSSPVSVTGQPTQQKTLYKIMARGSGLSARTSVVVGSSYLW